MKKTIMFVFSMLVLAMFISTPLFSATEEDLIGTWETHSVSKLRISRIGSTASDNYSTTTLNDNGTFTLAEVDSTGEYNYTGNWELIKDGKKMLVGLDENGRDELIRMFGNWMMEMAEEYGASVSDISISIAKLTISQPSIPKKTNIPRKITIKSNGLVSAILDSEPLTRNFSYISKVSFLSKQ
jgi:hypothetical protein